MFSSVFIYPWFICHHVDSVLNVNYYQMSSVYRVVSILQLLDIYDAMRVGVILSLCPANLSRLLLISPVTLHIQLYSWWSNVVVSEC